MEGKTDDTLSNPSALVLVCDFRPGNHLTLVVSRCKILQSPRSLVTWDPKLEHRPRHSFKLPPVRNSSIAPSNNRLADTSFRRQTRCFAFPPQLTLARVLLRTSSNISPLLGDAQSFAKHVLPDARDRRFAGSSSCAYGPCCPDHLGTGKQILLQQWNPVFHEG